MFCTNCGASNTDDAKFCVNCGESLSEGRGKKESSGRKVPGKLYSSLRILFDFSFRQCLTPDTIKFLYGLSIFAAGLIALLFIIFGFNASTEFGIFPLLIGAPLLFLLVVISSRLWLEVVIVLLRISGRGAKGEGKPESKENIEWNV